MMGVTDFHGGKEDGWVVEIAKFEEWETGLFLIHSGVL